VFQSVGRLVRLPGLRHLGGIKSCLTAVATAQCPERKVMAKTQRKLKKANHGKRPASAKARRLKRKHIRT
jgi:hypothetical protein